MFTLYYKSKPTKSAVLNVKGASFVISKMCKFKLCNAPSEHHHFIYLKGKSLCCATFEVTPQSKSCKHIQEQSVQRTVSCPCYWVHVCFRWNSPLQRIRAHFRTRF